MNQRLASAAVVVVAGALSPFALHACSDATKTPEVASSDATLDDVDDGSTRDDAADVGVLDVRGKCPPRHGASVPTPLPTNPFRAGLCSAEEVVAIMICSFRPAPGDVCRPQGDASAECVDCLLTPADAATNGALVREGSVYRMNVGGCVENIIGANAENTNCAVRVNATEACASAACAHCLVGDASVNDYESCRIEAFGDETLCAPTKRANQACYAYLAPGGKASACASASTFVDQATDLGWMFCTWGGLRDAGAD